MIAEHLAVARGAARIAATSLGRGPPVVLLPSLGRGAEDFSEVAPLVAEAGFRVILPEPRGIGGSTAPEEPLTLLDLARDVSAVLAAAGPEPAIVAGHAFGNWVARSLSLVAPGQLRAVILLAASIDTALDPAIRASIDGSFDPSLSAAERLGHLQRGYFAPGHDASVWLDGWHAPVAWLQRAATAAATDPSWRRVADRHATLYVAAAQDRIAPVPSLEKLRATLGERVSLTVVPDAGHALLPEQPAATAEAIIRFARGLP